MLWKVSFTISPTFFNLTDCFQGAVRKKGSFPASGISRASIAPVAPDFENTTKLSIFMLQMKVLTWINAKIEGTVHSEAFRWNLKSKGIFLIGWRQKTGVLQQIAFFPPALCQYRVCLLCYCAYYANYTTAIEIFIKFLQTKQSLRFFTAVTIYRIFTIISHRFAKKIEMPGAILRKLSQRRSYHR